MYLGLEQVLELVEQVLVLDDDEDEKEEEEDGEHGEHGVQV